MAVSCLVFEDEGDLLSCHPNNPFAKYYVSPFDTTEQVDHWLQLFWRLWEKWCYCGITHRNPWRPQTRNRPQHLAAERNHSWSENSRYREHHWSMKSSARSNPVDSHGRCPCKRFPSVSRRPPSHPHRNKDTLLVPCGQWIPHDIDYYAYIHIDSRFYLKPTIKTIWKKRYVLMFCHRSGFRVIRQCLLWVYFGYQVVVNTLTKTSIVPESGWLEDEVSYWEGLFSGDMLVSGRVTDSNGRLPRQPTDPQKSMQDIQVCLWWKFSPFQMHFWACIRDTLLGTNISHLGKRKLIFKSILVGDMLVPWLLGGYLVCISRHLWPKLNRLKYKWKWLDLFRATPRKLTWRPKMMVWKRWLLLNMAIFGIYVKFQGCKVHMFQRIVRRLPALNLSSWDRLMPIDMRFDDHVWQH